MYVCMYTPDRASAGMVDNPARSKLAEHRKQFFHIRTRTSSYQIIYCSDGKPLTGWYGMVWYCTVVALLVVQYNTVLEHTSL